MLNYISKNKKLLNTNKLRQIFHNRFKSSLFIKFSFTTNEQRSAPKVNPSNENSIEQEKESWNQFLDFMMKREHYTWNDYLQQIIYSNEKEKGIWRRLRSRNDDEKEEVLITKKFVSCLFEDEITKEIFEIKEIKDIMQISELSDEIISPMIFNFRYYKGVHEYLMKKKKNNQSLPKTQNEMQDEFIEDPPKFMEEIQKTMYNDIKKRLNYSDEYIQKMERNRQNERFKSYKRTHKY